MDTYHYSCIIKLFTFSLTLFCLLSYSCTAAASTTATFHFIAPPSSALLAADTLLNRGYSLFASVLVSLSTTTTTNFSGTLLAPPDFAFSFTTAKFLNKHRPPPRPSIPLLLYHTIKPPLILTWPTLSSRADGYELRTLYNNNCLFLFQNSYGGEVSISPSPFKNPIAAVKIRQPDLYVDEHLTVHGIDGVLDPTFATKCTHVDPTMETVPRHVNRTFLDHVMRALRGTGFNVVAAAMAIRRSELLSLTSVTVFAVSDEKLFLKPGGFRYDFRHHVVPMRHRFSDLAKPTEGGMELDTLAPNKTVVVDSVHGAVSIDGVAVEGTEAYHNRWIVVVSVMSSFDDVVESQQNPPLTGGFPDSDDSAPSPTPFPGISADIDSIGTPPPASELDGKIGDGSPISGYSAPSLAPFPGVSTDIVSIGAPPPSTDDFPISSERPIDDGSDTHCDMNGVVSIGVEGGDLFCPVNNARELRETESSNGVHVEESKPLDAANQVNDDLTVSDKVKIEKNVNVANDLFFNI
ncbi:hypothetical protein BUALT_Bualt01G0180400 [Buddleja alternifolia]|uniref:Fasciclin-like arabinogalactan protein n=1 Tax=Buddleja alternifolia TaxID=168488 RepID=A0AAV6YGL2_9LAMI|nr:hypothetical protein BUALT_Bualt01G0180400 [Buddleja alternifolia]